MYTEHSTGGSERNFLATLAKDLEQAATIPQGIPTRSVIVRSGKTQMAKRKGERVKYSQKG